MADDTTYCPYCGASMRVGATFCPSCGAQIGAQAGAQSSYGGAAAPAPGQAYGQQYNENVKLESNLKTVGIITIVLAVLGILSGIILIAMIGSVETMTISSTGGLSESEARNVFKIMYAVMGVGCILLAVVGGIGAYCCMKKTNYGLGLAMYIIALVLSIVAGGPIGIIIAILLLVFYTKAKPVFN